MHRIRRVFIESWRNEQIDRAAARCVLNFLEDIGTYVFWKFIEIDVAFDLMSAWACFYWDASWEFVEEFRQDVNDPRSWERAERLVHQFRRIDGRAMPYSREEVSQFFDLELAEFDLFNDH
jgi:hypothetical protein